MMQRSLIILCLLFTFIACRDEKPNETWLGTSTDTSATETASATAPGSPGGTAVVPDVATGTTVLVVLEDGSIAVREQSIPPGPAILTVENRGTQVHNLFIEGEGIDRAAGDTIAQGGTSNIDVMLKEGTYTFYCPVLDHREKGEQIQVTVKR
jgi:uncharacterized cupredoxin-like copper-binding protein